MTRVKQKLEERTETQPLFDHLGCPEPRRGVSESSDRKPPDFVCSLNGGLIGIEHTKLFVDASEAGSKELIQVARGEEFLANLEHKLPWGVHVDIQFRQGEYPGKSERAVLIQEILRSVPADRIGQPLTLNGIQMAKLISREPRSRRRDNQSNKSRPLPLSELASLTIRGTDEPGSVSGAGNSKWKRVLGCDEVQGKIDDKDRKEYCKDGLGGLYLYIFVDPARLGMFAHLPPNLRAQSFKSTIFDRIFLGYGRKTHIHELKLEVRGSS